ncbi:MAG: hypothetical protein HXY19_08045 [Thermoanaerobaculaceae bacterium]|nr:hypothetical protein [Thermoanaerobaculaceae bacterium]
MEKQRYATVKVTVDVKNRRITCDPDPVKCYWVAGPENIRWTFPGLPPEVDAVTIEWERNAGSKYKNKPMFYAQGVAPSTSNSHLGDIVTAQNVKEKGKFKYAVFCFDRAGNLLAQADPEGDNDDIPIGP